MLIIQHFSHSISEFAFTLKESAGRAWPPDSRLVIGIQPENYYKQASIVWASLSVSFWYGDFKSQIKFAIPSSFFQIWAI